MSAHKAGPDIARSRMRTTVASIDRELARLTEGEGSSEAKSMVAGLTAPWADLVRQLALGPEPEVRECPSCMGIGMRQATVCAFCWTKLEPAPKDVADEREH